MKNCCVRKHVKFFGLTFKDNIYCFVAKVEEKGGRGAVPPFEFTSSACAWHCS